MGVQVADTLAWLSDELRSECSQPVLQRARGIANQWRSKMEDLHCLNDTASNRITLYATIRGTTSPSSRYEVQATLDFADELFLGQVLLVPGVQRFAARLWHVFVGIFAQLPQQSKISQFR